MSSTLLYSREKSGRRENYEGLFRASTVQEKPTEDLSIIIRALCKNAMTLNDPIKCKY